MRPARPAPVLLLVLGCAACAPALRAGDAAERVWLEGRWSFTATVRGEHIYRTGVRPYSVQVSGDLTVLASGGVALNSSHGGCEIRPEQRRATGHILGATCQGVSVRLDMRQDPPLGTVTVALQETREERSHCGVPQIDAGGRPTGACMEWIWLAREVRVQRSAPAQVWAAR